MKLRRSKAVPTWPPPIPPVGLRELVGQTDVAKFDNPTGEAVFPDLADECYDSVFDWGCGCGRLARRLMLQTRRPRRYVGIDLHRGMVDWCAANLAPSAPEFEFHHHDVWNPGLNPAAADPTAPFPVEDSSVSLFIAWSVFTHVNQDQASFYLGELARILRPGGVAKTTWFLFDKHDFPMMQDFQNALFINDVDTTNAVIFDKTWLLDTLTAHGLLLDGVEVPGMRGFQWLLTIVPAAEGRAHAELPADDAPRGVKPPPLMPRDADRISGT